MKTYAFFLLLGFTSCTQTNHKGTDDTINADTLRIKSSGPAANAGELHLDQIPVSTEEVGAFPYLDAPKGYKYDGNTEKKLEEKYFFYNDSLVRTVSGQYFHTTIFPSGSVFEDTFVVATYKEAIEKLGGLEIYSGGLPQAARILIDEKKPAYVSDMYDPRAYQYKQFLIRTPKENIWTELCHGLNSNQIDLTVVKEER